MGPLQSVRVLDFTTLLPGPYATLMLADMGAEVLRVESPHRPDVLRGKQPLDGYSSTAHSYLNRNKRSLALDLKQPGAVDLVKELVRTHDVVVEQFRPGVMARLGVGYDDLRQSNPRVIFCSLSGYGQSGPYRSRAGHDCNYVALAGMSSYCSGTATTGPLPTGFQIADVAGGSCHTTIAILAAIVHRQRTGEGQCIDVSMTDAALALNTFIAADCLVAGQVAEPGTGSLAGGGIYGYYRTRDGRWMSVGSLEPQFLHQLCQVIGFTDPPEDGFATQGDEVAGLKEALKAWFASKNFEECRTIFSALDACVEPVLNLDEAMAHPLFEARQMIAGVPTPDGGSQRQLAAPIRFSASSTEYRHIGAKLGEHTDEVLTELGKSPAQIDQMRRSGLFG